MTRRTSTREDVLGYLGVHDARGVEWLTACLAGPEQIGALLCGVLYFAGVVLGLAMGRVGRRRSVWGVNQTPWLRVSLGMTVTAGRQLGRVAAAVVAAGALVAMGCSSSGSGRDDGAAPTTSTTAETSTTNSSTTSTTTERPATNSSTTSMAVPAETSTAPVTTTSRRLDGDPAPGCVSGWTTPVPGTALRLEPLDLIRAQMGVTGDFQVIDMRHFTSPEVPWVLAPRPPVLQWWYVKAQLVGDPTFRARWLIVRRSSAAKGIAAVAHFDTQGYQSPDWRDFIGEGEPRAIEGLPGTWTGFEFDFTKGEDNVKPGLPEEAIHCLDNT